MALTSSGEISLLDIFRNREDNGSATGTDIDIQTLAVQLASGSTVGDVDGNGTANQTADRTQLNSAPHAFDEFYSANYPNDIFSNVVAKIGSTAVTDNGYVDGETAKIEWDIDDGTTDDYTAGLKYASDNTVVDSATLDDDGNSKTVSVNITIPNIDAAADRYYPFVTTGTFSNIVGNNIDHFDALGTVTITDPDASGIPTVSNTTTNTDITHARSIADDSSVNDYNWSFVKTSGDGQGVFDGESSYGTVTSTTSAPTIRYRGPGIFTADLRVDGNPSQARNSSTAATVTHEIEYVNLTTINSISSVNATTAVTVAGTNKGLSGGVTFGLVDTSDDDAFLSGKSANDTVDSRYIAQNYTADITAADSNSTLTLQGRVIDRSDSTTNQNRNTSTFSVFPLLTTGKNTINAGVNTVYSSTNNSAGTTFNGDSTSYVNTVAYGTPGTATDNVTAYAYSINTAPTGWSFSAASSATTNFAGGTGVSTGKTVTLTVTSTAAAGDSASDQSTATTHTLALLFKPCIIAITHTGGVIVVNDTSVVVSALSWQGFADGTGFQLSIRNAAGQVVSENTTVNYNNTEGSTTTQISKTSLSIDLGDSSEAGTMKVRVARRDDLSLYRQFDITISDFTSTVIQGVGAGYGTPEQALVAELAGGGGWSNTTKKFQPGDSFGNGIVLFDDNAGTVFNGGANYHGTKPGSTTNFFSVATNGVIGNIFVGRSTIPPRAPSGLSNSSAITAISVSNYSVANYTFSASGTTTATFNGKTTTKTVTVSFNDNSAINQGYEVFENNSSGTSVAEEDANDTSAAITGITGNKTYAVHAVGNSNGSSTILSLGTVTTGYTHSNTGQLFLQATNNSGGATTNLGTVNSTTSGTQTITWDKDALAVGTHTVRLRRTSYTGTQVAIDSSVVVAPSFGSFSGVIFTDTVGPGDTDTSNEVTITLNSAGGTVAVSIVDTTGQSGEMNINYRLKAGGGSYSSYGSNPSVSAAAGSVTITLQAFATQVKDANSSGTGVIKLVGPDGGSTFDSANLNHGWTGEEAP